MEKSRLRVLSYNIHKGFSIANGRFVLSRIRDAIRTVQADLVLLQEVIGAHDLHRRRVEGWPEQSQFEFLADSLWPHFAYGKNAVYTGGHHGNAILSKYPFSAWENIDISTNQLERRGLLHGVIEIPRKRKPVHVLCVHLGLLEAERHSQVNMICERISKCVPEDEPIVMAGDFNDWRERLTAPLSRRLSLCESFIQLKGIHARSFPAWLPALKLDRIYSRGMTSIDARCLSGRPWSRLSDHVALFAELSY